MSMTFDCVKLSTADGDLVAYGQIPAYVTQPHVLFYGGRVFRAETTTGFVEDEEPPNVFERQVVPGLEGVRKVFLYVEAFATQTFAKVNEDGRIEKAPGGKPVLREPGLGAIGDISAPLLKLLNEAITHFEPEDLNPLWRARNLLSDTMARQPSPMPVERDPDWRNARARLLDEWAEVIYNNGGITWPSDIEQLHRDAIAIQHELDRMKSQAAPPAVERVAEAAKAVQTEAPRDVFESADSAAAEDEPLGIVPMVFDDGSRIIVDAISGGMDSTDGVPNGLTLCLIDAEGNEQRETYHSNRSLYGRTLETGPDRSLASPDGRAVYAIWTERLRQLFEEGWSPEHDDEHDLNQIANAAAAYAMSPAARAKHADSDGVPWPWPWALRHWKPASPDFGVAGRRRELVKAGALIVAELERLARTELASLPDHEGF